MSDDAIDLRGLFISVGFLYLIVNLGKALLAATLYDYITYECDHIVGFIRKQKF